MENFLDRIEDFLEAGAAANALKYGIHSGVYVFSYNKKKLVLINKEDKPDIAVFDDMIADIPDDFISHVLENLQPTEIEIKKC